MVLVVEVLKPLKEQRHHSRVMGAPKEQECCYSTARCWVQTCHPKRDEFL